jgi:hypothetical protein
LNGLVLSKKNEELLLLYYIFLTTIPSVEMFNEVPNGTQFYLTYEHCWRVNVTYVAPNRFIVDKPTDPFLIELNEMIGMHVPVSLEKLMWYFHQGTSPLAGDKIQAKSVSNFFFITTGFYKDRSISQLMSLRIHPEDWNRSPDPNDTDPTV